MSFEILDLNIKNNKNLYYDTRKNKPTPSKQCI